MFGFTKNKEEKTNIPLASRDLTDKINNFIEINKASINLSILNDSICINTNTICPLFSIRRGIYKTDDSPYLKRGDTCFVIENNENNILFLLKEEDYLAIKYKVEHIIREKAKLSERSDEQVFLDFLHSAI